MVLKVGTEWVFPQNTILQKNTVLSDNTVIDFKEKILLCLSTCHNNIAVNSLQSLTSSYTDSFTDTTEFLRLTLDSVVGVNFKRFGPGIIQSWKECQLGKLGKIA